MTSLGVFKASMIRRGAAVKLCLENTTDHDATDIQIQPVLIKDVKGSVPPDADEIRFAKVALLRAHDTCVIDDETWFGGKTKAPEGEEMLIDLADLGPSEVSQEYSTLISFVHPSAGTPQLLRLGLGSGIKPGTR